MKDSDILTAILEENLGYLKTADAVAAGVSKTSLGVYVHEKELERVAHGLYLAKDAWRDSLFEIQVRYPKAIFSHETALFFLRMTDREPLRHSLTLAKTMGVSRLREEGIKTYRIREELFEIGLSTVSSSFGHTLRCYNAERTICDILRYRKSTDTQDLQVSLNTYFRSRNKDLNTLLRYAKLFSIEKPVRQYLEVLLP